MDEKRIESGLGGQYRDGKLVSRTEQPVRPMARDAEGNPMSAPKILGREIAPSSTTGPTKVFGKPSTPE